MREHTDPASSQARHVDWLRGGQAGFGTIAATDELYHGADGDPRHDVCETWWYEVHVPESAFAASFYVSVRPNLNVCSAGTWMWRGHQRLQALAEHLNYQVYLPVPEIDERGMDIPQVGLGIEVVAPLERTLIAYDAPDGSASARLTIDALFQPVMRANGKHFEGATRATGTITVGETTMTVDSYGFRDRSWGEPRPELALSHPPIGWLWGVADRGRCAFNLSGLDNPDNAEWKDAYPDAAAHTFYDGWLYADGELRRVVSMDKHTRRDPQDQMRPVRVEADFTDDHGDTHRLVGEPSTSVRMHVWPNNFGWFGMTEWTLDGQTVWGECQDYVYPDYLRRFSNGGAQ